MELDLIKVSKGDIDGLVERAVKSPRRRTPRPLHEESYSGPQALFNAMMPDSYAHPHLHDKREIWLPIKNEMGIVIFNDDGEIRSVSNLSANDNNYIEIPERTFHTVIAYDPYCVFFNISQGPYNQETAKLLAPWAPAEEDRAEAQKYFLELKERILTRKKW